MAEESVNLDLTKSTHATFLELNGIVVPMIPIIEFSPGTIIDTQWQDQEDPLPDELAAIAQQRVAQMQAEGKRVVNGEALSLHSFDRTPGGPVLTFRPTHYFSSVSTHGSLETKLPSGMTVREKYGGLDEMLDPDKYAHSPYAKLVGTSTVIVTTDNKVILQRRSGNVAVAANQMHVSLAEGMHKNDRDAAGKINPVHTALRGIRQELSDLSAEATPVEIQEKDIQVLALGISEQYLQPEFALMAHLPMTSEDILTRAKNARGKWERVELIAEDFTEENITQLLQKDQWSPHASFALVTALKTAEQK